VLSINVEMPPGSSLDLTETELRLIESRLATVPEIKYYLSASGQGGGAGLAVGSGGARFGRVQVVLVDRKDRQRTLNQVVDDVIARTADIPVATIRVQTASGGGGSAQPVQVLITGDDPQPLQAISGRVQTILDGITGARNVTNSVSAANPRRGSSPIGSAWPTLA